MSNPYLTQIGADWLRENPTEPWEVDALSLRQIGQPRSRVFWDLLTEPDIREGKTVLEVGCGLGTQLRFMLDFKSATGCDIDIRTLPPCVADVVALPYADAAFDYVFTCGLLIHLPSDDLLQAIEEITRVAKLGVFGYEYYGMKREARPWRGTVLWRDDWVRWYEQAGLTLVKERRYPHIDGSGNVDVAFLLSKNRASVLR